MAHYLPAAATQVLTTSDANGSGRIVIPKNVAEAHFPAVESQDGVEVAVADSCSGRHAFRFRYWINSQSRMYLLEGTQDVQAKFNMGAGDVLVFGRKPDGSFLVHGRKGTKDDASRQPQVRHGSVDKDSKEAGTSAAGAKKVARRRSGETLKSKRIRQAEAKQQLASAYEYWAGLSVPPRRDGVFRAVPQPATGQEQDRIVAQYGCWSAIVSLEGELFQAFFDSYDAARAALEAAAQRELLAGGGGFVPPPALAQPRTADVPAAVAPPLVPAA
eukprot:scaffold10.g2330.t1